MEKNHKNHTKKNLENLKKSSNSTSNKQKDQDFSQNHLRYQVKTYKNLENQWKIQDIIKRSRLYSKSCTSPSQNTGKNQNKSYKKQNKSYKIYKKPEKITKY